MQNTARFKTFVQEFTRLIDVVGRDEQKIFIAGKALLQNLIRHDDWLPEEFSEASPNQYQQFLLHCDPLERFSIASFVWGPGQLTPIHDHTVWGMVGVMQGGEICEEFAVDQESGQLVAAGQHTLHVGDVDLVSPAVGDIHRVSNALSDDVSISIHIYGANIGVVSRHTYEANSQEVQSFISGYTNPVLPNIWG
ncbi:cysteine dioxygenase [Neptunomonas sp.]|uniref:cysteine dioxygenase family protein n=1 Tax=Neptunomonas sp. TaxID=1971898 RepID=UPI0025F3F0C8|nr:cysteine dioxygenase [Neptunomonas sp.]